MGTADYPEIATYGHFHNNAEKRNTDKDRREPIRGSTLLGRMRRFRQIF
jgi:hypothetical protein